MMTYQEEQAAQRETLRSTLEGIAGELEGWRVEYPHDHNGHLVSDAGVVIYTRLVTYGAQSGRLELSAGVPAGAEYSAGDYHGLDRPQISVSPDRGAVALARDVSRRLIPGALEYWQAVGERVARRVAALNGRETLARELAGIMGTTAREWRSDWTASVPTVERTVNGERRTLYGEIVPEYAGQSARCELRGMSSDQARELAQLIARWKA